MKKSPPRKSARLTDQEQVEDWMDQLNHPLKQGIELIRNIIKKSDKRICERIKWNAPSYYHKEDIITFGPRKENKILLVFHHPHIVKVKSKILEGDYKNRRLVWFSNGDEIKIHQKELARIMKEIIAFIDGGA